MLTTGQSTKPSLSRQVLAVAPQQTLLLRISHTVPQQPQHRLQGLTVNVLVLLVCKSLHKSSSLFLRHSWNPLHWRWLTQCPCHALWGCPSLLREQRCSRICSSPKALFSGCSLKTVTIYSSHLSSQNPHGFWSHRLIQDLCWPFTNPNIIMYHKSKYIHEFAFE